MNRKGFEALADGTMLLTVLLIASTLAITIGGSRTSSVVNDAATYAEDTRVAIFRTSLDALSFAQDGREVFLPNGTSVETFLRLQVHLESRDAGVLDFGAANRRIAKIAMALVRPGWTYTIVGRLAGGPLVVSLPQGVVLPESYSASSWSYPSLDGSGPDTVLSLSVWLSPRR